MRAKIKAHTDLLSVRRVLSFPGHPGSSHLPVLSMHNSLIGFAMFKVNIHRLGTTLPYSCMAMYLISNIKISQQGQARAVHCP